MKTLGIVVAFFATVVACSTTGSGGGSGTCADYAQAIRDGVKACGRSKLAPGSEDAYYADLQKACELAVNAPGSGVNASLLGQCVPRLREYCGDDDACGDLFDDATGTLGDAAGCESDYQCASGNCAQADPGATQGESRCGKCAPAVAIGQPCPNGGCAANSQCISSSSSSGPGPSKCVPIRRVAEGEACDSGSSGDTTIPDEVVRCNFPLECVRESATVGSKGVCRGFAVEGDACGESGGGRDCKPGLACIDGRCGQRHGAGESCDANSSCQSGLACDATKKCVTITFGAAGAACDDQTKLCANGFCGSGTTARVCVDYLPVGAACDEAKSNEQRCSSFARCVNGSCQIEDPAQCK